MKTSTRKNHTIDATGKAPGRLATEIATLLMGKNKATFAPNVDDGDEVTVSNAEKMVLTGNKLEQKNYYHHTRYGGGFKTKDIKSLWAEDPCDVLRRSVDRMLPKNRMRTARLLRLHITK